MILLEEKAKNENYKIAVVVSRFNEPVTSKLEEGAVGYLQEMGVSDKNLVVARVPGAVEIPYLVQEFYEKGFDGVVAVGAVIRGETAHFDYVCQSVERGCSELSLKYRRPLGFGVITTENAEQAYARAGGKKGNKGAEAAEVVLELLQLKKKLDQI